MIRTSYRNIITKVSKYATYSNILSRGYAILKLQSERLEFRNNIAELIFNMKIAIKKG